MKELPLISVVVPMYNDEKFIGELLDSLTIQTLKNFEVIIVDDCSTDNGVGIVKSYQPKFDGRLRFTTLKKNSGGPSVPRNKGIEMSRGKYIFFMDNDDFLKDNALKILYNAAENSQADVIFCERFFEFKDNDANKNIRVNEGKSAINKVDTLMTDNISERLNDWLNFRFGIMPWQFLYSRDFLIDADIKFSEIRREDILWSFKILCLAKKILRVVTPCYVHRIRNESLGHKSTKLDSWLGYWMNRTVKGLKLLEDFMLTVDFFKNNPAARYTIMNHWAMGDIQLAQNVCKNIKPHLVKEVFQSEFKADLGDNDVLVSYLFSNSLKLLKELLESQEKLKKLSDK